MNKRVNSSYAMIGGLHRKDEKGYDEKRIIDDGWNMEDGGRRKERGKSQDIGNPGQNTSLFWE